MDSYQEDKCHNARRILNIIHYNEDKPNTALLSFDAEKAFERNFNEQKYFKSNKY